MKNITRLSGFVMVLLLIGLTAFLPPDRVAADGGECLARMSEETTAYIREMKIPLKGADARLYANRREQVYLLSSEETVKLNPGRPVKSTVAVIDHKDAGGRSVFYVIDQEIAKGQATLTLKRGTEVLQTFRTRLPTMAVRAQAKPDECDCSYYDNYTAQRIQFLQAEANRLCVTTNECVPICTCPFGKMSVAITRIYFQPTSWRCRIAIKAEVATRYHWFKVTDDDLLDDAFDTAVEKAVGHYSF
jgi:hypothetical protein